MSLFSFAKYGKYKDMYCDRNIKENELFNIDKKVHYIHGICYLVHGHLHKPFVKGDYHEENSGEEKNYRYFNPNFSIYENLPRRPRTCN